jgi:hypothetical protein
MGPHFEMVRQSQYLGVLLAALLAAACFSTQASAGDPASILVVPAPSSVQHGQTMSVDLVIDPPAASTAAWVLELDYNPSALKYVSCHALDAPPGPTVEASDCHVSGPNSVSVLGSLLTARGKGGIDAPTRVGTITFTTIGAPGTQTPLAVSVMIMADPNGSPEQTDTHNGSVSITAAIPGDTNCDGDVNLHDLMNVLKELGGLAGETACWDNADANHDGHVDARDALIVLKQAAGIA